MATLATLIVKLAADIGGFSAEMEKAELKAVRSAERVGKAWKKAGDQLSGTGKTMTAAFTLPIVGGAVLAVDAFSDLNESANAVNVVFGDAAGVLHEYGQTSATTVGLATAEFNQMGAVTGAFLKNLGFDQQEAAEETINLTERAADMASIFNTDVSSALQAIQSGLKGEFNPLEQFGVKLNAAAIEAKAIEMNLADATGEVNDAAKAQAALALIYEQTNQVAGDFANTSDGMANQTRIAKAEFTNLAASIGQMLMPYAIQLLGWVREGIAWFNALDPSMKQNILTVLGIVAVLGPLLVIIGSIVSAIGTLIPIFTAIAGAVGAVSAPVLIVVAVIIGALALLYAAWQNNWGGIREKTAAVWEGIKSAIATAWQFIQNAIQAAMTIIGPLMQAFQAAREGDWRAFGEKLREAWDAAWKLITTIATTAWENLKTGFSNLVESVISFFRDTDWGQVGRNIIEGIGNGIINSIEWLKDAAKRAANAALEAAKGFLGIESPSKVFEHEVGWEMGAGQISGYEKSLKSLMPATAAGFAMPSATAWGGAEMTGGGMFGSAAGGGTVIHINMTSDGVTDERDVARKIAGAVGVLLRERGLA
ncbi:hypothetical protein FBQ81_03195 [Chloroflexi bacterium CFX6]|nr:hypothetical protein [Chloroflexi bacterium CFX6]